MGFVSQVDNISGLLQGDVSKDGIEYGIKSAGASTLGLAQMKKLAQEILATPGFDKNKLLEVK
jgi:O-succinylbenzoate synthase